MAIFLWVERLILMDKRTLANYQKLLGKDLIAIIKYEGNYLFVTKNLEFETLGMVLDETLMFSQQQRKIPLFLTEKEIHDSLDVFPLEFLDIKSQHEIIHGKDVFNSLTIRKEHVRHQLEFEFRSKIIKLREAYFETADVKPGLIKLLDSALATLRPIAKGLLFLKNKDIPTGPKELFDEVDKAYHVQFTFYSRIIDSKKRKLKLTKRDMKDIIKEMLEFLDRMSEAVQKMQK